LHGFGLSLLHVSQNLMNIYYMIIHISIKCTAMFLILLIDIGIAYTTVY